MQLRAKYRRKYKVKAEQVQMTSDFAYGKAKSFHYFKTHYGIWNIIEDNFTDYPFTFDMLLAREECKRMNDEHNAYQREIIAYCKGTVCEI